MAKKPVAESTTKTPSHKVAGKEISLARRTGESRGEGLIPRSRERERVAQPGEGRGARPSSLLDTRVIYCGDNLEPAGRMQNEKCRMMKPACSVILHSSFILLNFPVPASHYVKVMLDQIFGENNFKRLNT